MSKIHNITCPNCSHAFDIEDVLSKNLEEQFKVKLNDERSKLQSEFRERESSLSKMQEEFEEKKKRENQLFADKLKEAMAKREEDMRRSVKDEYDVTINAQKKELEEKRKQVLELKEKELEIQRIKNKMAEVEKDFELKYEKKLSERLTEKEDAISKRLTEQVELKLKEKDKQLQDQSELIEELKRKKDQGSMQLQGEIQELVIEDMLRSAFPFDIVEEVPKGVRGADSMQTVVNAMQQVCGKIIFESKRTKAFSKEWIDKLKMDQRNVGAELAVLVTSVLPKEISLFGSMDGIWICGYQEMTSMVSLLRQTLIKTHSVSLAQENKGDKKEILYSFVSSEEFKQQVGAIIDGFSKMKEELDKEKRAMHSIWKRREKQIDSVIQNTIDMHASIKGIAGDSILSIETLELDT